MVLKEQLKVIMKKLKELKENFKNGMMTKSDFINAMHDIHTCLFEYSDLLKETEVSKIEITDDSVIMTLRESGIKMICDKDDKRIITIEILNFDSFEKEELKCVTNMVKEGSTIMDVGANIGFYSLNLFKEFTNIRILAFEPVPKTYNYLKTNLQLNNCTGVEAFNFGFSDEHKNIDIYLNPECSGNSSLANLAGGSAVNKVNCKFTTIDKFAA
jgi:FkbM family methyltransferase